MAVIQYSSVERRLKSNKQDSIKKSFSGQSIQPIKPRIMYEKSQAKSSHVRTISF